MIDGRLWVGGAGRRETPARWGILAVVGKRKGVAETGRGEGLGGRKQGNKVAIFSSRGNPGPGGEEEEGGREWRDLGGKEQGGKVAIFSSRDSNTGLVWTAIVSGQGANITGNPMPLQPVGNFFSGLTVWRTQFLSCNSTKQ